MQKKRQEPFSNTFIEEKNPWWHIYLLPLYLIAGIVYMTWRLEVSLLGMLWYTIPLFIVELYNTLTTIIHLFVSRRIFHPVAQPPIQNASVDAFIPTYNEPQEIVEMTARAALAVKGIRNVFILDDGKRENIRALAKKIGAQYLCRPDNMYAKAGNMNYGLIHTNAEFVAFFDCDHAPLPQFIEKTIGYFKDKKLAFVQTPQVFYNSDTLEFRKLPFRNLWNEQTMFYESIQPAKNAFGAAFFCGTSAILRRSALDSVGGFATETATEDIHTSLRLHAKGWRSIFLSEKMVFGLAPLDLKEYHNQRVRWGAGSLGLLFRTKDSPLKIRGLTFMQRVCYFNSTNAYFYGGVMKLFYILMPIIFIFSLPFLRSYDNVFFLNYLAISLPFVVFSNIVIYAYSRKTYHPLYTEQYNIANIFSCIEALKGVIKIQKKFVVSIKSKVLRENHIVYYLILGLFTLLGLSEIFGLFFWFGIKQISADQFLKSSEPIALYWNTWNLIITGSFIWFLKNYKKKTAKKYPFESYDSIILNKNISGKLAQIGLSGAYILADRLPRRKKVSLCIKTKLDILPLSGIIIAQKSLPIGKKFAEISFTQLTEQNRNHLVRYFFEELVVALFKNDFSKHTAQAFTPQLSKYRLQKAYEVELNT